MELAVRQRNPGSALARHCESRSDGISHPITGTSNTQLQFLGDWDAQGSISGDKIAFSSNESTVSRSYSATTETAINANVHFTGNAPSVGNLIVTGTADFSPTSGPATLTIPSLQLNGALMGSDSFIVSGQAILNIGNGRIFTYGEVTITNTGAWHINPGPDDPNWTLGLERGEIGPYPVLINHVTISKETGNSYADTKLDTHKSNNHPTWADFEC